MRLVEMSVERFRNLSLGQQSFGAAINLVLGANGVGKTSLLEAVVVLGNLRSFREPGLRRAVQHGQASFRISAVVEVEGRKRRLEVSVESGTPVRRHITVDGQGLSVDRYLQVFPVFAVTGPDRELVNGGPEERRALLDRFVFLLQPVHLETLRIYRRSLRQRNAALSAGSTDAEIEAWEAPLSAAAARLVTAREAGAQSLAENFSDVYESLATRSSPPVSVEYRSDPWCEAKNNPQKVEETYRQRYNETRMRDRQTGFTVDGPHRHDLSLRTDGRGIRYVLSTGQTKIVAAALRLATLAEIEKERRDRFPVIVDDVDAELDHEALVRLVNHLGDKRQLFLSSTSDRTAAEGGWRAHRVWLESGACVREEADINE